MAEKEEKVVVNHTAARRVSMLHAQSALRRATLAISKESTPSPRDTPAIEEEDKIFQSGTLIKKGWDGWTKIPRYFELTASELRYSKANSQSFKRINLGAVSDVQIETITFPRKTSELVVYVVSPSGKHKPNIQLHRQGKRSYAQHLLSLEKTALRLRLQKGEKDEVLRNWEIALRRCVRKYWKSILCSGFARKWSLTQARWITRFLYITEKELCVVRGGGLDVLKQNDSSSFRTKFNMLSSSIRRGMTKKNDDEDYVVESSSSSTDNVSVVNSIPLSRIRSVKETENTWSKEKGDNNDSVLSIQYGSSDVVESIQDAVSKNSRVLNLSGTPIFVKSLKDMIQWASKNVRFGGGGDSSSRSAPWTFETNDKGVKNSALQLKKLSRAELEDLVLSSHKTINRLRRQNTKLNSELERMQAEKSHEKSRIRTLTNMLMTSRVKKRLTEWKSYVQQSLERRASVIKQWLDSEMSYGSNLRYATNQYASMLESLKTKKKTKSLRSNNSNGGRNRYNSESSNSQDSFNVSTKELQYIFGNIEDVAKYAERLASELDEIAMTTCAGEDKYHFSADRLADFIAIVNMHMERESKAIRQYMENYLLYVPTMLLNAKKDPWFLNAMENVQKSDKNGLDLESLLVQPVQRLPRRRLLLKDIIKFTHPTHSLYSDLKRLLLRLEQSISDCDKHLNVAKLRQIERITMSSSTDDVLTTSDSNNSFSSSLDLMKSLTSSSHHSKSSSNLSGSSSSNHDCLKIIVPNRRFCQEGELRKLCSGFQWRKRYVYIFSDCLMYSHGHGRALCQKCDFSGADIQPIGKTSSFELSWIDHEGETKTTKWKADSKLERDQWVGVIREQITSAAAVVVAKKEK